MKKSRLNLFRVTSMTISILGVIMIVATVLLFAYIGFDKISQGISLGVDSGSAYDDLAALNSDYSALKIQYDSVKKDINQGSSDKLKKAYISAELELVKTKSAIDDVDSALSTGKSDSVVNERIKIAKDQLQVAKQSLSDLRSQI
ncbi:MAG: hypothetical protein Q7U35_05000 [Methanobacteriaceae archaeon]|nr:hypothetical protein [Methanobacteriaceae archaeon]MDP2837295.1 hypothetical protein [Methanobacteriaceae archaeon]MDP3033905.1 hypothetical protein [Methanobacteriaceae archaeon]MDP3483907.1 hypothetical protein [Methanobacteriaceae archaeon]